MDEHEVAAVGGDLGLKSLETISGSGLDPICRPSGGR
jgi:hypothetical protein